MLNKQGFSMRYRICILLIVSLLAGCSGESSNSYSLDKSADGGTSGATRTGLQVGIGDVESNMRLNIALDESSYSDTIRHEEEFTKMEWIARASVDIASPYPSELNILVFSRSVQNFPGNTYRATVTLYLEENIIYTFKYIVGRNALGDIKRNVVDIMPFLDPEPGRSVLLFVRAEIEFFPNTEEETISLDSTIPAAATATKTGNPLTVTFAP